MLADLETTLETMELGPLLGLWLQSFLIKCYDVGAGHRHFVIVYGRMLEIYMLTSLAPIPMATISHREVGQMGRIICAPCLPWAFKGCLFWYASPFMRC